MRLAPVSLATRLLPASTNDEYRGSPWSARLLALFGILTIVPGCIHSFLPDGGAGVIAGLDLDHGGRTIVALFAWAGATQIAFGITMLLVSIRYRSLVPLMLTLLVLERGLHAVNAWGPSNFAGTHRPPEHYAVLVGLPLIVIALAGSLRSATERHDARSPA